MVSSRLVHVGRSVSGAAFTFYGFPPKHRRYPYEQDTTKVWEDVRIEFHIYFLRAIRKDFKDVIVPFDSFDDPLGDLDPLDIVSLISRCAGKIGVAEELST
uniref:XRN_M domain-containing protein n=1 Tax=Ascaris lumbricoides TaxID=6252 RepID=A0A0M3ICU5_ASCLU